MELTVCNVVSNVYRVFLNIHLVELLCCSDRPAPSALPPDRREATGPRQPVRPGQGEHGVDGGVRVGGWSSQS